MAFVMFKYVPSILTFLRVFIKKGCYIFWNAFSASIDRIIWFLSFLLLTWCITLIDLRRLNQPCIPGMNPTCSWWIILFICYWIPFASILLRIISAGAFSYMAFMMVKSVSSILTFLRVFIKKRCCILSNASSASIYRIIWVVSFFC